jgi:hypothetical protein
MYRSMAAWLPGDLALGLHADSTFLARAAAGRLMKLVTEIRPRFLDGIELHLRNRHDYFY